ncbi:DMT family transporter [Paramaledivibacter caminithermalis]|jgi:drug/metabolite transporter (DMT)-like permease|uniref:Permease of the drug/metabolite transporter (DMT) superfamily n=1 Tax=Paramaledivibacter caminithermalis (strain DSM 15212 / CIP 107654 / DViRD3) TaxID=1121301 RepID=A0A1M6LSL5_PARC5|nr:DMT family transporter [Paramaledivibacter caminithermalis]SHJ74190.1 Permease of the drug/metabolite transporter (DMT) superfamily [Paramaledivibacter caminithermalis DSM 15212]
MSRQLKADLALLFVTIGWGASFILTKIALTDLEIYNFLAIRFLLAFIISSIFFIKKMIKLDKKTIKLGILLGIMLYLHYAFQTVGLKYTTASKSAFITGLNVIMVPIFSPLLLKKIPKKASIYGAILAFIGMGLLSLSNMTSVNSINIGDVYTFICAVIFALYIIAVGKFTSDVESISFAVIQLGVVGILSLITSFAIEQPVISTSKEAWISILILSIVCTSAAYIIQNVAQRFTSSTHTALIYTGEPVFAAIFGYIFFRELLNTMGTVGAILILMGMITAEIDFQMLMNRITRRKF